MREAAGWPLLALVIGRQVGADDFPGLPGVRRNVQKLAGDVDGVAVVRRDVNDVRPVPTVLGINRGCVQKLLRPHIHRARHTRAHVVAFDAARVTSAPDDVRIFRIGNRKARFATRRALPRNVAAQTRARAAHRRFVLLTAVQAVRHGVVGGDVIHLRDGQGDARPLLAVIRRNHHARVIADHHAVSIGRVGPHIVIVAAPRNRPRRLAAIHRNGHRVVREINLILVLRRDQHACVIVRTLGQDVAVTDDLPLLAAVF